MKVKLFLIIVALAVGASVVTFVVIRVQEQKKEEEVRQKVNTATTNMMREMKPLTAPPIFPEKKK